MSFKQYLEWLDLHIKSLAFEKKTPHVPHPGEILKKDYLSKHRISQTELSRRIGCTHAKVNEVINGKRGITAGFALDLEKVTGIRAETWMRMQVYFDLETLRRRSL